MVEKEEKKSEGEFSVSLPPVVADLVEADPSPVKFTEGEMVEAVCNKLENTITELWWECNGKRMENGEGNVKIVSKKTTSKITFDPATLADAGTCTCHAIGQGTEDSAGSDHISLILPELSTFRQKSIFQLGRQVPVIVRLRLLLAMQGNPTPGQGLK